MSEWADISPYDRNPYYSPEFFGLEIVAEADPGEAYEFNTFVLWKDSAGKFFYATDSGCSCPAPFENHSLVDLSPVKSRADLAVALSKYSDDNSLTVPVLEKAQAAGL